MKNLKDILTEGFIIKKHQSKDIKEGYINFIKYCGDLTDNEKDLINNLDDSFSKFMNNEHASELFYETPLFYIVILCAMLVADNNPPSAYDQLGYKEYKKSGSQNPYDYSQFEEELDNGDTALELVQTYIDDNYYNFKNVFNIIKRNKDKFSDIDDLICNNLDIFGCKEEIKF